MEIEVMFDYLREQAAKDILIEQTDGKQYIIKQPVVLSSNIQSIAEPKAITNQAIYEGLKLSQFIDKSYKIKPQKGGHIQLVTRLENGQFAFSNEYEIQTVFEVVIAGEMYGYMVYCNSQEVVRYAKD